MINSIQNSNVFTDVSSRPNYWLPEIQKNKKSKAKLAMQIGEGAAATAILGVGTALFITQGGVRGLNKYIQKLTNFLDKQIQKSKLENEKVNVFLIMLRKIVNATGEKFEAANNFNTIKDFSLQKILFKQDGKPRGLIGKSHQAITNMFERIAKKTVLGSWQETSKAFEKIKQIPKHTIIPEELELEKFLTSNFSKQQNIRRFIDYKNSAVNAINNYFSKKGFLWFWHTRTLNTFVAQLAVESVRANHKQSLMTLRNFITQTPKDVAQNAFESIAKIAKGINFTDKDRLKNIIRIERDFRDLARAKTPNEIEEIKYGLRDTLLDFERDLFINNFPDEILSEVSKLINNIENLKPGKVQEILEKYKKILPENEYKQVEKKYAKFIKSLDKSIKLESEDYTAKVRDLLMGSAPTDIMSIFGGLATLGYFLAKSDDNNKRISTTLKYGIPALTTIGTVLYANTRLFAGTKSLTLGAASGFITGKICGYLNDKFIQHVESKKQSPLNAG